MPVAKALEKKYSQRQDGDWLCVTRKVTPSPYGPWGPWYRFTPLLRGSCGGAQSHPSVAAGTKDNRWGRGPFAGTYSGQDLHITQRSPTNGNNSLKWMKILKKNDKYDL